MVKRLPTMRETRVRFLGREDPLQKKMATHSSTLAWKIPWMEEPGRLQSAAAAAKSLQSCPALCNHMDCSLSGLLYPWDFPGKSTGVGCHFLLQRIFSTQGSNPGLPHCRKMFYHLSHQSVFIFASFPFYASKNLLTVSFSLYFCGTTLPWLSSYIFGHFSLVSVFRLIFSPSPWMCPTPDSIFCSFFSYSMYFLSW